jgi:hypothetical protein
LAIRRWFLACAWLCASFPACAESPAAEPAAPATEKITIGYLRRAENLSSLSRLDLPAANDGEAGAQIGVDDDAVTGEFLGQSYELVARRLKPGEDAAPALAEFAAKNIHFILADLPAEVLVKSADTPDAVKTLIFNVGASDDFLRQEFCRANVVHVAPSRAMLADGLAQYLVWKQWRKWFLVLGSHPADRYWADSLRRSAARFGAKIVEERVFGDVGGARRADSRFPPSPRTPPPMTCWWPPTKARFSPPICPFEPGTRAPSPAPPGSFPRRGTRPTSNGARRNCRTASRGNLRAV